MSLSRSVNNKNLVNNDSGHDNDNCKGYFGGRLCHLYAFYPKAVDLSHLKMVILLEFQLSWVNPWQMLAKFENTLGQKKTILAIHTYIQIKGPSLFVCVLEKQVLRKWVLHI